MDQLIRIGDGNAPVWATYHEDECGPFVIEKLTTKDCKTDLTGYFTGDELAAMAEKLYAGHDRAVSQLNSMFRADRAADRAAFEEVYA